MAVCLSHSWRKHGHNLPVLSYWVILQNITILTVKAKCVWELGPKLWSHSDLKLWLPKSNQFMFESKWTFLSYLKKSPQGVSSCSEEQTDVCGLPENMTLALAVTDTKKLPAPLRYLVSSDLCWSIPDICGIFVSSVSTRLLPLFISQLIIQIIQVNTAGLSKQGLV